MNSKLSHVGFGIKITEPLLEEYRDTTRSDVGIKSKPTASYCTFSELYTSNCRKTGNDKEMSYVCCTTVGKDGKKLHKEMWAARTLDTALCPAPGFETFDTKSHTCK